jgi:hypothetical protein
MAGETVLDQDRSHVATKVDIRSANLRRYQQGRYDREQKWGGEAGHEAVG